MANFMLVYLILAEFLLRHVELKGCKNKTLGLRDDVGLPHYYFQGTSYSPESTNKNINKNSPDGATWCPDQSKTKDSFLEVDLGKQYLLCGVSTQGDNTYRFTKSYKIEVSPDRITWEFYQNNGTNMIFDGNEDATTMVYHPLNLSEKTRFVRFYPNTYETNACMRVELYGQEIRKERCEKTVIDASVPDVVVTSFPNISASKIVSILNGTEQWCWSSTSTNPYLKVDFRNYSVICAMRFSFNGMIEISYGNEALNTSQMINGSQLYFPEEKILTKFLQLKPIKNSSCLSVKMFGYLNEELLNEDIGFQYKGSFPDESLATSEEQFNREDANPSNGRLYKPWTFWCRKNRFESFYLEFVLVQKYYIFAVSIHGRFSTLKDTTEFSMLFSHDYAIWQQYDATFTVNYNNRIEKHSLSKPLAARIARIRGPRKNPEQCIKVELHGIMAQESSEYCGKPHPLGVSYQIMNQIPDGSITASSPRSFSPSARLRKPSDSWCGDASPNNHWISVDLGQVVSIFGVATQGFRYGKVTEYKMRYSFDDRTWYGYPNNASLQIFSGNSKSSDDNAIFANWLNDSVIARHIKLEIQKYSKAPCLRLEQYGCKDVAMPVIEQKSDPKSLNRTINTTITLICQIRGQAGIEVSWKRNGRVVQESSFEKTTTDYPQELVLSAVTKTQINITYKNDQNIYDMFNCTGIKTNSRRLLCRSIYSCSATYPGANTSSQGRIPVTVTPDIVLPDVPRQLSISNIKSRSAVINWNAADDYLESRLEKYVIQVSSGSYTMRINVTSGIKWKNQTYRLQNLVEYTFYNVSIAAESAVAISDFTKEVTLLTLYGPYITLNVPNVKKVEENYTDITILCTGKSYPTPDVIWKKDGKEIQLRENLTGIANDSVYQIITPLGRDNKSNTSLQVTSTLFLRPNGIKYEDYGNYTCEVLNKNESSIPLTKTVEVQFPPRITKRPNNAIINEGENVSLTCDAEGPPKPTFTWSNVSEKVTIEKIISKNNKVELLNVRSVGRYHFTVICIASNKGGSTTANATIKIWVKPRIIDLTESQTALLYDNVTLVCEVLANPAAQVWWTKDGDKSHESNVEFKNDKKTLVITKAELKNIGNYSCHANNSLSYTNKSLRLDLKALPKAYVVGGKIKKLNKGEKNSNITCLGYGYPNPKATWKIDGMEIPLSSNSSVGSGVYQRRSTNDPVLKNVTSTLYFNQSGSTYEDFGNYTCEVSIAQAPETNSEIVKVIFYPVVLIGPRNRAVLQDENVRFDCEVDGRPNPSTSWLFKNQIVSTNHSVLSNGSLLLYSVQNNDLYEGEYSCYAENEAGQSEKSKSYLTVHVPAKIVNISKTETYQLMTNVCLTCDVEGDPRPRISWTKANYSSLLTLPKFELSNYNQTLKIMNVSLEEQGTYICYVENKYDADKRNVIVNVEVRPEAEVNTSSAIYFNNTNEKAIIRCRGRGHPSPVVNWFRDGKNISTNNSLDVYQVFVQSSSNTFLGWATTILYVNPDSNLRQFGNYSCNATKLKDKENDLKFVEIVLIPTVSITPPNTSTVLQGTNVNFTCTADGSPKPTITWSRMNGTNFTARSVITTSEGKSVLNLTNVTNKEEGMYECTAYNRGKPVKKQVTLVVHVKPQIRQQLQKDDVENGTSYKLNCSAYGDPALTYSWTKDGNKSISNATPINGGKTLHINQVTIDSEGTYTCMVSNIVGSASTTANITVFAHPKIVQPLLDQTQNESDSVKFSCGGYGIPTPEVIWMKVGKNETMTHNNSTKFHITNRDGPNNFKTSSLTIRDLKYADRGNYSYTLKNRKSSAVGTAELVVQVRPVATIDPNSTSVNIGKSVIFTCKVYGFPKPQVSWRMNEQEIRNNSRYTTNVYGNGSNLISFSKLEIKTVIRNDTANYSCVLRNAAGTTIDSVSLVVLERPDPVSLSSKDITSRSVVLNWMKNFNGNAKILNFNLTYFINASKPDATVRKLLSSSMTSYKVTSLKPYSKYIFEMTATNEIGVSDVSSESVDTLEDKPSSPQFVNVDAISSTSLNVTWQPPSEENGVILNYIIYYQRVQSDKRYSIVATSTERNKIIRNLKPYTNYSVEVAANASVGYGNKSDSKIEQTKQGAPSSPRNLTVQVKSNTTISVTWVPPENENGIIITYGVYVREQDSNETMINVSGKLTSTLLNSLKPYTHYTFRIRAQTIAGWGSFSETKIVLTDEGLPSKPENFATNVQSNTSVELSWSIPLHPNGVIVKYYVYYKAETESAPKFKISNETQYSVEELTPYTNYSFWVHAKTLAGLGNKSDTRLDTTFEGVPTEPQNVTARALNTTSIIVNWTYPLKTYGIIVKYVVHYREMENETVREKIVKNRLSELLISLAANTEYYIFVQAFTSAGGGEWSERIKQKTNREDSPTTYIPTKESYNPSTMIPIKIPEFSNKENIIFYRVIVMMVDETVKNVAELLNTKELKTYEEWKNGEYKIGVPYVAYAFKGDSLKKTLLIGNDESFDNTIESRKKRAESEFRNGKLLPGREYVVAVRGYTTKDEYSTSLPLRASTAAAKESIKDEDTPVVLIVGIVVAVALSALVLAAIWFRIKKKSNVDGDIGHNMGIRNLSHPVPLPEFRFYVQSKQFSEEFQEIPKVVNRETSVATRETNMQKNRYKNIIPYDYTRVFLHSNEEDEDTDYINATFIEGLKVPSKYIATQGPLPHTANDFWQMIWEQEVSVIVMLTGLEEKGNVKCYQYWPANTDENEYGNLTLKLTGETVLADFTTRFFELKEKDTSQVRLVQHLHFTAWPDHGVPKYPGPLLHFHKRYRSGLSGSEPVVVHCSAGVGRTGTFITLDYILHKLEEERNDDPSIDILHFVRKMRGQRMYMVQTEEQYRFIHYAILEAITFPDTEISSADIRVRAAILKETLPGVNKTKGKEVFENLQKRIAIESSEEATMSDNQKKNRSQLLPFDYNRVVLNKMPNSTDYINASFICGYQYPVNFIATQHPLPHTVSDFWRMVLEQKSSIVVAISTMQELNEFGAYWPEEGFSSYGPINVAIEEINEDFAASGFIVRTFKLTNTRDNVGRSFVVTHFHFYDWSPRELPTASAMLCLLAEVEKTQRSCGNTLLTVHCSDGGGRTGTFCAIVSCIERVKLENNVDLPLTVRNLRAQRTEMVEHEAQYIFCYDVISAFLSSFDDEMYDNFKEDDENYPETTMDDENRLVSKF